MFSKLLEMSYQYGVASMLLCAVGCWGSKISSDDSKCLNKLCRRASSIAGLTLSLLEVEH